MSCLHPQMLNPQDFRITLAVHRVPPESRVASKPAGRIVEGFRKEEMLEGGFCSTRTQSPREVTEEAGPCPVW